MLRYRIFYVLTLAGALLFYLFYSGYLSFFVLSTIILLPIVSWTLTLLAMRKTSVGMEPQPCAIVKGEKAKIKLTVKNASIFPIAQVGVKFNCENSLCGEIRSETLLIPAVTGAEQTVQYELTSLYCGRICVTLNRIKYYDYLGIFSISQRPSLKAEIFAAPRIALLDAQADNAVSPGADDSAYSRFRPGDDPSEIFDIRPYRGGDSLRRIHWKLSTKLGELMVKEFSLPMDSSLLVLAELTAADMTGIDTVVEVLASLSAFFTENQIPHGLGWYDVENSRYREYRMENEDDLPVFLNGLLASRHYSRQPHALESRRGANAEGRRYPRMIYVTGGLTEALVSYCRESAPMEQVLVLFCGSMEESQKELKNALSALKVEVVEVTPGRVQETLSGLTL